MGLTRRWLFGLFGGAAATRALPMAQATPARKAAGEFVLDTMGSSEVVHRMTLFDLDGNKVATTKAFLVGWARNGAMMVMGTPVVFQGPTTVGSVELETKFGDEEFFRSGRVDLSPRNLALGDTFEAALELTI